MSRKIFAQVIPQPKKLTVRVSSRPIARFARVPRPMISRIDQCSHDPKGRQRRQSAPPSQGTGWCLSLSPISDFGAYGWSCGSVLHASAIDDTKATVTPTTYCWVGSGWVGSGWVGLVWVGSIVQVGGWCVACGCVQPALLSSPEIDRFSATCKISRLARAQATAYSLFQERALELHKQARAPAGPQNATHIRAIQGRSRAA